MTALNLPPPWYWTPDDLAHAWGISPARVLHYCDVGYAFPAALVHKAELRDELEGPSPYVVVPLPDYRSMMWTSAAQGRVAALAGPVLAYEFDCANVRKRLLSLDAPVLVTRSDLVLMQDAVEAILAAAPEVDDRPNPTKVSNLLRMLAASMDENDGGDWREGEHYAAARWLSEATERTGRRVSIETVKKRLAEAVEEVTTGVAKAVEELE